MNMYILCAVYMHYMYTVCQCTLYVYSVYYIVMVGVVVWENV